MQVGSVSFTQNVEYTALGSTTSAMAPPALVNACAKFNCSSVHTGALVLMGYCTDSSDAVLQLSTKVWVKPFGQG